jgi:hypothetical protein
LKENDRKQTAKRPVTRQLHRFWLKWSARIRRTVPPGVRTLLGIALVIGGFFGFLPILGFWMIPLGIAVIAMDIRSAGGLLRRWWNGR